MRTTLPALAHGWAVGVMAVVLGLMPAPAPAFIDQITIIPAQPRPGEPIEFLVRSGQTDFVVGPGPLDREVLISGSTVRATILTRIAPSTIKFPTFTSRFVLGRLTAGTYRFELFRRDQNSQLTQFVTAIDFVVAGPPFVTEPVPTLDIAGQLLLLLLMLGAGVIAVAMRETTLR